MLSRPELKLEAVQRNYIRVRVADGEDLFDLGHFSDEQLNRLHEILDLRLGHSDLGTFEGRVLTDSLHSWSYWSLYFWREHEDLGLMIQNRDCENVAWARLDTETRGRWRDVIRSRADASPS